MSDNAGSGFGKFVPGFEFLQNLAGQAAGGVAQGLGSSLPQLPNLSSWVAPTINVEDLEKRIEELKAVHFWLDQNSKALAATIQALEVQKMTLSTLKTMNFSLGDVANALKLKAGDTVAGFMGGSAASAAHAAPVGYAGLEVPARAYGRAPSPAGSAKPPRPATKASRKQTGATSATPTNPAAGGVVDPVQWWGALSQQFQHIAANAMKDVAKQSALDTTRQVASGLTGQAVKTATGLGRRVTRGVKDSVGRGVGAGLGVASGMGQAVARAAAGSALGEASAQLAAPRSRAVAKKTNAKTNTTATPARHKSAAPASGKAAKASKSRPPR